MYCATWYLVHVRKSLSEQKNRSGIQAKQIATRSRVPAVHLHSPRQDEQGLAEILAAVLSVTLSPIQR